MKKFFGIVFVISLSSLVHAQDSSMRCDHYKDGDDSVTVCETDDYKSVIRCSGDGSGCVSSSGKKTRNESSDATLRKLCNDGMNSQCLELADRVRARDKVGTLCSAGLSSVEKCKQEAEEAKLNDETIDKYMKREEAKRAALTLDLCEKKVYDKPYCDEFKKKLQSKAPAKPTEDRKQ